MQVENDKLCAVVPTSSEVHIFNVSLEGKKGKKEKKRKGEKKGRRNTISCFGSTLLEINHYSFQSTSSFLLSLSSLY